ncbi:hypothetical protein QMT40_001815 [Parvibaculaceae bacterium PLY_AMNH_Bact1]|nr:hypothetical protein QMT40_001815 [Parvibaculaceae bacterium PLY_AMNH_Bact1]
MIDEKTEGLLEAADYLIAEAERQEYFEFANAVRQAKSELVQTPAFKKAAAEPSKPKTSI